MATLENYDSADKTYININAGALTQKAEEGENGAKLRSYEFKDGEGKIVKGEKWEKRFASITGTITDMSFYDGNFGMSLNIVLDNEFSLQISKQSRYFASIIERLASADLSKPVTIRPYDFESEGRRNVGVSVKQDEEKLQSHFYDSEKKKSINGIPQVTKKDRDSYDGDDWKVFFIKRDKFLMEYVKTEMIPNIVKVEEHEVQDTPKEAEPVRPKLDDEFSDDDALSLADIGDEI